MGVDVVLLRQGLIGCNLLFDVCILVMVSWFQLVQDLLRR